MLVNIRIRKNNIEKFINDIGNINITLGDRQIIFEKDVKDYKAIGRTISKEYKLYNVTLINKNKNIVIKNLQLRSDRCNYLRLLPQLIYKDRSWKVIKQHKELKPYWMQLENLILNSFIKAISKYATIRRENDINIIYSKKKYIDTVDSDVIEL